MLKLKKSKTQKGITLIALIITIVVLLILAAVAISSIQNDGILSYAENAAKDYNQAVANEQGILGKYEDFLINGGSITKVSVVKESGEVFEKNTQLKDDYGNILKVPAGFKIATDSGTNVVEGIVIEDVTANGENSSTKGSQFVWVPVGNIKTGNSTVQIALNRYTFDSSTGAETPQGDAVIDYCQELATSTYGNTTAINIESFKSSVGANGGYYIGRYEASQSGETIKTVSGASVYGDITQPNAATKARNMYQGKTYTSDLVNSYAWDTAIVYIQKLGEKVEGGYANYNASENFGDFTTTGGTGDEYCKINDMSGNAWEWTTETWSASTTPCIGRGGSYDTELGFTTLYTSYRGVATSPDSIRSFRPILYVGL